MMKQCWSLKIYENRERPALAAACVTKDLCNLTALGNINVLYLINSVIKLLSMWVNPYLLIHIGTSSGTDGIYKVFHIKNLMLTNR